VLTRSIEHEQNKVATIGEQLKQAQESQNQLLKELNTKRSCLERKFKDGKRKTFIIIKAIELQLMQTNSQMIPG
jgi:hypothetical protein